MSQGAAYPDAVPVLEDGTVRLRAHRRGDRAAILEQCRDPESARWTTAPQPYGEADAEAFLATVQQDWERAAPTARRRWAVEALDDGRARFAGTVGYRPDARGVAEIEYGLHPWARGRGVMRRAVDLALEHAFTLDGVDTVRWQAARGNWASRRVAWAGGFTHEGTVRARPARPGGQPQDGWIGSLRADEPRRPGHRWLHPTVLTGTAVVLRPWRPEDRQDLQLDAAVVDFVGPVVPETTEQGFETWLLRQQERMAAGAELSWCLADPHTDHALGWLGVFGLGQPFEHGSGTVGYWLVPAGRGRGVLTEALRLAAMHAFAPAPVDLRDGTAGLGLHRLAAATDVRNAASQAALVRGGWRWVGTEQDSCVYSPDGARHDTARFEVLAQPEARPWIANPLPAPPRLSAERLLLRPFATGDLPVVRQMLREPDIGPDHAPDAGAGHATRWWTRVRHRQWAGAAQTWAVCRADGQEPIGWLTAYGLDDRRHPDRVHVGYWLAPRHRGAGLSHEALEVALGHLTGDPAEGGAGRRDVRADTTADNLASQAVLRRAGFTEWAREDEPDGRIRLDFRIAPHGDRVAAAAIDAVATVEVPTIDGDGVRLRAWRHDDAERVVQGCSDPLTQHFLADVPRGYTRADATGYIEACHAAALRGTLLPWCLADPTDDRCLGALAIMDLDVHRSVLDRSSGGVLGYWLHPDARGRGVLTEALRRAVRHAFLDVADGGLGLDRLALRAAGSNPGSQAAAHRAGFTDVGRDRAAERLGDGSVDDLVRFDLLREEWIANHPV